MPAFDRIDQLCDRETIWHSELAADPTNALAVLAALRRAETEPTRLAAVQRILRAQPFGTQGQQHFSVLGLVTAGRDRGNLAFERETLGEQLGALVAAIRSVTDVPVRLALTDLRDDEYIAALVGHVREVVTGAEVVADPDRTSGRGYYRDLCFKIFVTEPVGDIEVGDGGFTDWTAQLLNDRKARLLTGGLGLDRLVAVAAIHPAS